MKVLKIILGTMLFAAVAAAASVLYLHPEWVKPNIEPEEKKVDTDVAVRTAKIGRATLHRYVECMGTVAPEQRRVGGNPLSASARVSSPVAGVVLTSECVVGQTVEKGAVLFQLDDRAARAEEAKAEAAIASAQATLAKLKASTRPEQIAVAEITLKKAHDAVHFAELNYNRLKTMAADQAASQKQVEEAALPLAAARQDESVAEKQLKLLQNTPAPEDIKEAAAKVAESEKALAAAQLQRALLTIKAPITGTAVKVNVNPGEPVDTTIVLAELVDLKRLEATAAVPATELRWLKEGQPVEIRCAAPTAKAAKSEDDSASAEDDVVLKGTLSAIGLQIDPKTDCVTVRVLLPADSGIKPGQSARLKITVEEHPNCLAVPEECVFRDLTNITVVAVVENGMSSMANVTPGLNENGLTEISGKEIKEGDTVVLTGAYGIEKDTKVHILGAEKK